MSKDVDRLLSPDKLSGPEHDAIFARIEGRVAPTKRPWFAWGMALTAAASAAAFFVFGGDEGVREKGTAEGIQAEVLCAPTMPCRVGSRLLVALSAVPRAGQARVSAVAADGHALAYFHAHVTPSRERVVLPTATTLGDEHTPGTWRLRVELDGQLLAETAFDVAP